MLKEYKNEKKKGGERMKVEKMERIEKEMRTN
jgi:hypothetical protein